MAASAGEDGSVKSPSGSAAAAFSSPDTKRAGSFHILSDSIAHSDQGFAGWTPAALKDTFLHLQRAECTSFAM